MAGLLLLALGARVPDARRHAAASGEGSRASVRARIERDLVADGRRHVVFVRDEDSVGTGWVYNLADIDGQAVVWAHDLGERENRAPLEYFAGRQAWRVTPHEARVSITPLAGPRVLE